MNSARSSSKWGSKRCRQTSNPLALLPSPSQTVHDADLVERYVETGFWNFDALFIPQQHPARDQQDTFFISDPPEADLPRADPPAPSSQTLTNGAASMPANKATNPSSASEKKPLDYDAYFKAISTVHSTGSHNSIGYRAPFSVAESQRLVLRTHTTAISTYMLYHL